MQINKGTLNNVRLIGSLSEPVRIEKQADGSQIATAYLTTRGPFVTNSGEFTNDHVESHRIIAKNQLADAFNHSQEKEKSFYVEGRLSSRQVINSDNQPGIITEVIADKIEPLDSIDEALDKLS